MSCRFVGSKVSIFILIMLERLSDAHSDILAFGPSEYVKLMSNDIHQLLTFEPNNSLIHSLTGNIPPLTTTTTNQ